MTGGFRVLDALATLAFDFPPGRKDRSPFFREELAQLLVLAQREGQSPASFKGSYAGAMGLGQFMPSSILKYAVDFDRDGHIDMAGSPADVIGSVANYLAAFGWKSGMPTHFAAKPPVDTAARKVLVPTTRICEGGIVARRSPKRVKQVRARFCAAEVSPPLGVSPRASCTMSFSRSTTSKTPCCNRIINK
jgi:membrane-bound lytic murein transglycosylase B